MSGWADFADVRELHAAARALGAIYKERPDGVKYLSRIAYEFHMTQPEPPSRYQWFDGSESPTWLEWWRIRGIDPHAYRSRGYRLPQQLRRAVIARDGYVCGLCGGCVEPDDVHVDHVKPRKLGGTDEPENLQVAHSFCNISKGARMTEVVA